MEGPFKIFKKTVLVKSRGVGLSHYGLMVSMAQGVSPFWVQGLLPPLPCCVIWDKLLNHSDLGQAT